MMEFAAIEIGFGTCAVASNVRMGKPDLTVFPSRAVPVTQDRSQHLATDGTSRRDSIIVDVNGTKYEVGPDVTEIGHGAVERDLTSYNIGSDHYQALFLCALSQITHTDTIDLLVAGLPINSMNRRDEIAAFLSGTHKVQGREITIKDVRVIPQPLGALIHHAKTMTKDTNQTMNEYLGKKTRVVVDPGFGTFDFLTCSGLTPDGDRSDAKELGQGVILRNLCEYLSKVFQLPIYRELVDRAFESNVLEIQGHEYPFPTNTETDKNHFDCVPLIDLVCKDAITVLANSLKEALDVKEFLVCGGPAKDYARALVGRYPNHKVTIVDSHDVAVCLGYYELARQLAHASTKAA